MRITIRAAILVSIVAPLAAQAQWLPNGTHIYNSNPGNVGIGTQTPGANLNVFGNKVLVGNSAFKFGFDAGSGALEIQGTSGSFMGLVGSAGADGWTSILLMDNSPYGFSGISLGHQGNRVTVPFTIGLDGTERFRITPDGRVGINTTSPAAGTSLHVNGSTRIDGDLVVNGTIQVTGPIYAVYQ